MRLTITICCLLLPSVNCQESVTPASLLGLYDNNLYYNGLQLPEPTKEGPVLFPNDGPPAPRPALIATAKPLPEAVTASPLYTDVNVSNTLPQSSDINSVYRSRYFDRLKNYQPISYDPPPPLKYPVIFVNPTTGAAVQREYDIQGFQNGGYDGAGNQVVDDDFGQQPTLPPIYKALSAHAKQKVVDLKQTKHSYSKPLKTPVYSSRYETNDLGDGADGSDYDHNSNYAFSYTVKDKDTGDDFSHSQRSSGSATNGEYRVRLPDGRTQIVSYTADENGYKADVRYDDEDKVGNHIVNNHKHEYHNVIKPNYNFDKSDTDHHYKNNYNYIDGNKYYTQDVNYGRSSGINDNYKIDSPKIDYGNTAYDNDVDGKYDTYKFDSDKNYGHDNFKYDSIQNNKKNDYKVKEDYYENEQPKDYYNEDYSNEYDNNQYKYDPHKSKFESLTERKAPQKKIGIIVVPNEETPIARVRPSIASLRKLFLNRIALKSSSPIPVEINVPSTTPNPNKFGGSTEKVVLIGASRPNLYTNINGPTVKNVAIDNTTPSSYLASTISGLRGNVNLSGPKPVLSESFIDRINKYLTF